MVEAGRGRCPEPLTAGAGTVRKRAGLSASRSDRLRVYQAISPIFGQRGSASLRTCIVSTVSYSKTYSLRVHIPARALSCSSRLETFGRRQLITAGALNSKLSTVHARYAFNTTKLRCFACRLQCVVPGAKVP
jgi:hypothetical protein